MTQAWDRAFHIPHMFPAELDWEIDPACAFPPELSLQPCSDWPTPAKGRRGRGWGVGAQ